MNERADDTEYEKMELEYACNSYIADSWSDR